MIFSHPIELSTEAWPSLTDQQLLDLCIGNKHLKIERDEKGNILLMSPTKFKISHFNNNLQGAFFNWNKKYSKGYFTDSNGGYILPDTSMRAPDIGFVLKEKYASLTEEQKMSFAPICPDFVVEIISSPEDQKKAEEKMAMWMRNGCQLAWLIDIFAQKILVFEKGEVLNIHDDFSKKMTGTLFLSDFTFLPSEVFSE
jgi:Uma2 family endonuclease